MSYNPNPGQNQWPSPNSQGQEQSGTNEQPKYQPPTGYAPPPNYQPSQPPFGYPFSQQPPYNYPSQSPYNYVPSYTATRRATVGQRFIALIIDSVIVNIITSVLLWPLNFSLWRYGVEGHYDLRFGLSGGLNWLILGIYALLSTMYLGNTIGKKIMRLRVVNLDGSRPTINTYVQRYIIGYVVSGVVFTLGFIWALFDPQKQGWHDRIANTYVVKDY